MTYLAVDWVHSIPTEPVQLYSELDGDLWEVRKVEVFADGTAGYASAEKRAGDTILSKEPLPTIEDIASDPQFKPRTITAEEFEKIWNTFTQNDSETPA